MTPDPRDNREHKRYAIDVDCLLRSGATEVRARSKDLSRTGMCCVAPVPLEISSLVDLQLALTFEEGGASEPLRLAAVVVWCTRVGNGHQLGLKFNHTTPEVLHLLDVFVQYLDVGV